MIDPRIELDAQEFGQHVKAGGWRLGLLVARNVEPGTGQGARKPRNDRNEVKVSAQEFARQADTSAPRVLRFLEAWNRAAADGIVYPASELQPGQEVDLDVKQLGSWGQYYSVPRAETEPVDDATLEDIVDEMLAELTQLAKKFKQNKLALAQASPTTHDKWRKLHQSILLPEVARL